MIRLCEWYCYYYLAKRQNRQRTGRVEYGLYFCSQIEKIDRKNIDNSKGAINWRKDIEEEEWDIFCWDSTDVGEDRSGKQREWWVIGEYIWVEVLDIDVLESDRVDEESVEGVEAVEVGFEERIIDAEEQWKDGDVEVCFKVEVEW